MAAARESSGRNGFAWGFLAGLAVAGIPLVLLLLRPPPEIVVQVPAASVQATTRTEEPVRGSTTAPSNVEPKESPTPKDEAVEEKPEGEAESPPTETEEETRLRKYGEQERALADKIKERLKVRVTNAETGSPLPRVDMSIFVGTANSGGCSTGERSGSDGSAELHPLGLLEQVYNMRGGRGRESLPFGTPDDPLVALVRIRVPGFAPFAAPATGELLEAKMEPLKAPRLFGTLQGKVLGPDGSGWSRPVVVSLQDPVHLDGEASWVVPGPDGRFDLGGIPAGTWGVKIDDYWGTRTRIEIPPGGAAEVELRVGKEEAESAHSLPEPRRAVSVLVADRDLPFGAAVLLEDNWGEPLRAAVVGGVASFPAVPVGAVRMTLRRPDARDESAGSDVREGSGVLEIPFPASR